MKITYHNSLPETLVPIIKERVETIKNLMPNWCNQLVIMYSSDNPEGYTLSCKSEYHYRFVQLWVYDLFFFDDEWQSSLVHEIMHAICAPYSTQAWQIVNMMELPEGVQTYLENQLRNAEESLAQDMADFVSKLTKAE